MVANANAGLMCNLLGAGNDMGPVAALALAEAMKAQWPRLLELHMHGGSPHCERHHHQIELPAHMQALAHVLVCVVQATSLALREVLPWQRH